MTRDELIDVLDQQVKEQDAIYRGVAGRFYMSYTMLWILYIVSHGKEPHTQKEICQLCSLPKQSINTTISTMVSDGLVTLQPSGIKNQKEILLTDAGREKALHTVAALRDAENRALSGFSEDELQLYLDLTRRINRCLAEEINKL